MEITLSEIYKYLLESFKELESILSEERDILINNKSDDLLRIVEEKRVVIKKISLLEEKRLTLKGDMEIDDIIEKGHISSEDVESLKKICSSIKEKNVTNNILTKQSLHYIRAIKFALTPNQNRVTTYGNQGKIGEGQSDSIFSTKL
ncbi:MAG: flagellar protein FlgN [Clostridium sp.]|uniref:flagellar protein FlgN n=1 Tax=Clostridium sp. TaxID=1506 RepID=UPI002FC9762A